MRIGLRRAFSNPMTWSTCSARKRQHFFSSKWTSAAAWCGIAWKGDHCSTVAPSPTAETTAMCVDTILLLFHVFPAPLRQHILPLLTCSAERCMCARSHLQQRAGQPLSARSRRTSAPRASASADLRTSLLTLQSKVPSASSSAIASLMLLCSRSCIMFV